MQHETHATISTRRVSRLQSDDSSTVIGMRRSADLAPALSRTVGGTGRLGEWLLAATLTSQVTYSQQPWELFKSSLYPAIEVGITTGRKRISLQAARRVALGVLADTEQRLWRERTSEARLLASFWDCDTDDLRTGHS